MPCWPPTSMPTQTLVALGGPNALCGSIRLQTGELLYEIRKHTDWIYAVSSAPTASCWPRPTAAAAP